MKRSPIELRRDAMQIWQAGVEAVRSERLVREALRVDGPTLLLGDDRLPLDSIRRIAVVGAGKAGAGMAAAVEEVLGPELLQQKQLAGWINVPADCVRPLSHIKLHAARPAGINEPTPEGAAGSREILRLVESLGPDDLCLCLISGGGSALMPCAAEGITLKDKLAVTQYLSAAGANIEQLNTVRKQLSRIKGGGLLRACRAGRLVSLIISDVLGDPLDVIASGPTVEDTSTPQAALDVLDAFAARNVEIRTEVFDFLESRKGDRSNLCEAPFGPCRQIGPVPFSTRVTNLVIGNNASAVAAAGMEAQRLGYTPAMQSAEKPEGAAEPIGRHLAEMALKMRAGGQLPGTAFKMRAPPGADCLVSGGEPVVTLVDASRRGLGGRSQQLVLAAVQYLAEDGATGIALLSGGTDGEDGPTDAAGAILDADVLSAARQHHLDPADYLARNDAYNFFRPLHALIKTGPTHTNVCDVRVVLVDRPD